MSAISEALKRSHEIYICGECAEKAGGVWPRDHVATFHAAKCAECGQVKSIAALSDWNWPGWRMQLEREF